MTKRTFLDHRYAADKQGQHLSSLLRPAPSSPVPLQEPTGNNHPGGLVAASSPGCGICRSSDGPPAHRSLLRYPLYLVCPVEKNQADSRMKRMVFDHYLRYPQSMAKAFFQPDMLHPNARGHVSLCYFVLSGEADS